MPDSHSLDQVLGILGYATPVIRVEGVVSLADLAEQCALVVVVERRVAAQ